MATAVLHWNGNSVNCGTAYCVVRMLILENLISRFENKNSWDLVENLSRRRIGVGKSPMSML